jgi:hypothetical protein
MNKQAVLDAVSQALDSMGMDLGDGDEYGESDMLGGGGGNEIPIWSKLQAGELGTTNGPIHDRALLAPRQMDKPPQVDNYGMPVDDQSEEMMSALGLV